VCGREAELKTPSSSGIIWVPRISPRFLSLLSQQHHLDGLPLWQSCHFPKGVSFHE
jgi:hypothetical protein